VTFQPNKAGNMISEASLTKGEVIRKAKVTPNGIPELRNPMNNGIDEHEQKGVTTPNKAANK